MGVVPRWIKMVDPQAPNPWVSNVKCTKIEWSKLVDLGIPHFKKPHVDLSKIDLTEGSLEVKLPTIWTDEKAKVGRVREEKRREEKKKEERRKKKEDQRRERGKR